MAAAPFDSASPGGVLLAHTISHQSYEDVPRMNPITGLLAALGALTAVYVGGWWNVVRSLRASSADDPATNRRFPTPLQVGVGAVTNFFDTLGIGSFATTTALFRLWKLVPDRIIPGTLNVGHTLPTVAQAF